MTLGRPTTLTPRSLPERRIFQGRSVVLEPLSERHIGALWDAAAGAADSFTYLRYGPFPDRDSLAAIVADLSSRKDQPFWAVCPCGGAAKGWLSLCDISPTDASIEIGSIWFSPVLQRSRAAREAIFLLMRVAMDDLGYARLVWRCQTENHKSFRAAEALGFTFEGTWREGAIVDGYARGVSWFSILAAEWPAVRAGLAAWCADGNFDDSGRPLRSLAACRAAP